MIKQIFLLFIVFRFFTACNSVNKPSAAIMKECLTNELSNKAIVESYDQQDGLLREKDGVKYYEGYFNAEIKFVANTNNYKAGQRYKIIKGTVSFMKTEKGWNCQEFDISATNIVKIKEQGETSEHGNAKEEPQEQPQRLGSTSIQTEVELLQPGYYIVNGSEKRPVYFHNAPDGSTKRKAYFSTQEDVYVQKFQNDFGYVEFTNTKGETSYGWVEKRHLIAKPN